MVCSLVLLLAMQPDPAAIRRLFEENLARQEKQYGALDPHTAQAARDLGIIPEAAGRPDGAAAALARALRADEQAFGAGAALTSADAAELGRVPAARSSGAVVAAGGRSPDARVAASALAALGDLKAEQDAAAAVSLLSQGAGEGRASGREGRRRSRGPAERAGRPGRTAGGDRNARARCGDRPAIAGRASSGDVHHRSESRGAAAGQRANRRGAAFGRPPPCLAWRTRSGTRIRGSASASMILAFCWRAKGDRARAENFTGRRSRSTRRHQGWASGHAS